MNVVIDTNVLLISIPSNSKYRKIFDLLINGMFELSISNEILSEYIEIIEQKTNTVVATNISELFLVLPNVNKTNIFFNWNLIHKDPDDNKFVDCAISAAADYIVTNDKHFSELGKIDFPKVHVLSVDEFMRLLTQLL